MSGALGLHIVLAWNDQESSPFFQRTVSRPIAWILVQDLVCQHPYHRKKTALERNQLRRHQDKDCFRRGQQRWVYTLWLEQFDFLCVIIYRCTAR